MIVVTGDMIAAVSTLRVAALGGYRLPNEVRDAINTLDNADVFASIDEESDYIYPAKDEDHD